MNVWGNRLVTQIIVWKVYDQNIKDNLTVYKRVSAVFDCHHSIKSLCSGGVYNIIFRSWIAWDSRKWINLWNPPLEKNFNDIFKFVKYKGNIWFEE